MTKFNTNLVAGIMFLILATVSFFAAIDLFVLWRHAGGPLFTAPFTGVLFTLCVLLVSGSLLVYLGVTE